MKITIKRRLWPFKIFLEKIFQYFFYRKLLIKNRVFKNKHYGEKCFIIGNGPSLNVKDLESIKGFKSFASNSVFKIFTETDWRPDYYGVCDKSYYNENKRDILENISSISFYPLDLECSSKDSNYTYLRQPKFFIKKPPLFSARPDLLLFDGSTVTYMLIQLSIYMGFKTICLLGVDFSYSKTVGTDGDIKIDNTVKDYFTKDKSENNSVIPNLEQSYLSYKAALSFAKKKDIRIINLSRTTKLDIFERANLEDIL
jgi:hypothetical protein